jgi:hypothetical protein
MFPVEGSSSLFIPDKGDPDERDDKARALQPRNSQWGI